MYRAHLLTIVSRSTIPHYKNRDILEGMTKEIRQHLKKQNNINYDCHERSWNKYWYMRNGFFFHRKDKKSEYIDDEDFEDDS